ncbi:hypothetical protein M0804_004493 [Polistes exclamans]|nr:hypothetical protein M0804_004493 [Polistes exclamans]
MLADHCISITLRHLWETRLCLIPTSSLTPNNVRFMATHSRVTAGGSVVVMVGGGGGGGTCALVTIVET